MDIPDVAYARTGGVAIAYQVVGSGPATVVYSPHLCSIDWLWRAPHTRRFLERLAERVRLIVFNPRGTGLSDRPRAITLETRMDDINAVLDDVSVDRVTLFGVSESANSCALYASTYPERCEQLVLFTPYVSVGGEREEALAWIREMREHWGERSWMETWAAEISPAYVRDPELLEWFVWMQRASASPGAAAEFARMQVETNIEDVLPAIKVPTLILYRAKQRDDAAPFAQKIPDVELQELPGEGFDPYGSTDQLTDAIVARALRLDAPTVPESILSSLLFTDLTDSTVMAAAMGVRHGASS